MNATTNGSEQTTLERAGKLTGADSPTVGETLEEYTHRAHTRYAATDVPGVVWYDPRDGREGFLLDRSVSIGDFDDSDDRILRRVVIRPFRPGEAVDGQYFVDRHYAYIETLRRFHGGEVTDTVSRISGCRDSEVFDSLEDARAWCRVNVDGYADAPRRDAVRNRE